MDQGFPVVILVNHKEVGPEVFFFQSDGACFVSVTMYMFPVTYVTLICYILIFVFFSPQPFSLST